ncbi:MAG: anti-sigma factor antagonist [Acidimicrobiales bacterium]|nr:anti-sigma factor antagonist [Acidimicrobiales bacterium]
MGTGEHTARSAFLTCHIDERPGRRVVHLDGEVDLSNCDVVADACLAPGGPSAIVELDLSDLLFIDCTGVNELLAIHNCLLERGGGLVVRDATVPVARVLELTGAAALLAASFARRRMLDVTPDLG